MKQAHFSLLLCAYHDLTSYYNHMSILNNNNNLSKVPLFAALLGEEEPRSKQVAVVCTGKQGRTKSFLSSGGDPIC